MTSDVNLASLGLNVSDLINLALRFNELGNKAKVRHVLEMCLTCEFAQHQNSSQHLSLHQSKMSPVKPVAFTTPREIHSKICLLLNSYEIGQRVSFIQLANYVESLTDLRLDRTITPTERREKWRKHVTHSIEKLRSFGCLRKGDKNTEYVLIRKP